MKLLQTLVEAVASKSQMAAQAILRDPQKLDFLSSMAAQHLKKTLGDDLLDTPMAMITQQTRSYLDATLETRLNKDDLERVTMAVVSQLRSHLGESADVELTEGKLAELDLDFDELSGSEFKKKYKCTKAEMRKKVSESDDASEDGGEELEEGIGEESVLGTPGQEQSVETVFHLILADELDAYDVMMHPQGSMQRQAAKIIQRMYDSHTEGTGLHGDDDAEQIMLNVYEDIEMTYGEGAGQSPFESVQESASDQYDVTDENTPRSETYFTGTKAECNDWIKQNRNNDAYADCEFSTIPSDDSEDLEEATRGRPRKNPPKEEKAPAKRGRPAKTSTTSKPVAKKVDDSDEDDDKKKVSSKALAKSMENDDGEEDADAKKADAAAKDAPKKIVDTSVKPDQLNTANKKLSKQIQHAVHTSSATSAFALSKELRATFKDITSDEVKQACTIWKSEN